VLHSVPSTISTLHRSEAALLSNSVVGAWPLQLASDDGMWGGGARLDGDATERIRASGRVGSSPVVDFHGVID
jgi:hypothetical protein